MGLQSGMDTESIIQATLRMHQFRIDNQLRNRRLIEWRQQTHNGIRDEIQSLRQTYLSNLGSKTMMNRNTFNATSATVTGKNAAAVSVRTITGANPGSIRINQVVSLASGANVTSANRISANGQGFSTNTRLDDMRLAGSQIDWNQVGTNADGKDIDGTERYAAVGDSLVTETAVRNAAWNDATTTVSIGGVSDITIGKRDDEGYYTFTTGEGANRVSGRFKFDDEGKLDPLTIEYNANLTTDPDVDPMARQLAVGQALAELNENEENIRLGNNNLNYFQTATVASDDGLIEIRRRDGADALDVQFEGRSLDFYAESNITINGKEITIKSNMTINQMLTHVNKELEGTGLTMKYEGFADRFTIESNSRDVDITASGELLDAFGISADRTDAANYNAGSQAEMIVTINGKTETIFSDTNVFNMGDAIITANFVTEAADEPINVTLARDASKAVDAIKDFINSYNSIIKRLEGLLNERKTGNEVSYKPLTDEEKSGMTEKQIEEWETIAKKGIMRGDQGIQNLVSSLRRSFFETIEGTGMSASQLGLTTGSHFDGTGGQIMINEERLRAALEEDPDRVADVFIKIDSSSGTARGVGLLHKIDGIMRDYVNTSQSTSIKNLEESLKRTNEQIARMEQRMFAEEDKLYRQFAAMETALARLQQQGDWFGAMM
jgi:flagellar hook-associated protein 2